MPSPLWNSGAAGRRLHHNLYHRYAVPARGRWWIAAGYGCGRWTAAREPLPSGKGAALRVGQRSGRSVLQGSTRQSRERETDLEA
jgi:hypothetical protein